MELFYIVEPMLWLFVGVVVTTSVAATPLFSRCCDYNQC
ncbi:hypothetical protein BVRB_8g189210 [Beta vulgaris subsp. vulgaris]|nr:hypothetical protein BVRB_8g189210 [Beta vulgaris subsp. vulgaris]